MLDNLREPTEDEYHSIVSFLSTHSSLVAEHYPIHDKHDMMLLGKTPDDRAWMDRFILGMAHRSNDRVFRVRTLHFGQMSPN